MAHYNWYDDSRVELASAGQHVADVSSYCVLARHGVPDEATSGFDYSTDVTISGAAFAVDDSAEWVAMYGTPALRILVDGNYTMQYRANYTSDGTQTLADATVQLEVMDETANTFQPFINLYDEQASQYPMLPHISLTCWLAAGVRLDFRCNAFDMTLFNQQDAFVQKMA